MSLYYLLATALNILHIISHLISRVSIWDIWQTAVQRGKFNCSPTSVFRDLLFNNVWWWKYLQSVLSDMVAMSPMWLLNTWTQNCNWANSHMWLVASVLDSTAPETKLLSTISWDQLLANKSVVPGSAISTFAMTPEI